MVKVHTRRTQRTTETQLGDQPTAWQGVDPDLLPRHRFTQTGVGCAAHGDPGCLCDVQVQPTDSFAESLTFGGLALQALGDVKVSVGNFYAWAELVLGMSDAERKLRDLGSSPGKATAWSLLDPDLQSTMRESYKAHIPWSKARKHLDARGGFSKVEMRQLYRYYNQRLFAKDNRKEGDPK